VLREGIVAIVAAEPDMTVVAEAGNGREAIDLFRVHRPDITLMDLQMPILSGTDAIAAIRVDEHPFQTWRQRSHPRRYHSAATRHHRDIAFSTLHLSVSYRLKRLVCGCLRKLEGLVKSCFAAGFGIASGLTIAGMQDFLNWSSARTVVTEIDFDETY
jgi:CheY-like chemotaxis protein